MRIALLLLALASCSGGSHAVPETEERERIAEASLAAVRAELGSPGEPDGAGEYSWSELFVSEELALAPRAGMACVARGCLGIQEFAHGSIQVGEDGMLRITLAEDCLDQPAYVALRELVPVRWAGHRFVVEPSRMSAFCAAANGDLDFFGFEMDVRGGSRVDRGHLLPGMPEVPPRWRLLLLDHAVRAHLVSVESTHVEDALGGGKSYVVNALADRGANDGLVEGMRLSNIDAFRYVIEITGVEPERCRVRIRGMSANLAKDPPPGVGFPVTAGARFLQ